MGFAEFKEAVHRGTARKFRSNLTEKGPLQDEKFQQLLKTAEARKMLGWVRKYWGIGEIIKGPRHLSLVYEYEGLGYLPEGTIRDAETGIKRKVPANTYHFAERRINVVRLATYTHGPVNQLPDYQCFSVEHLDTPASRNISDQLSELQPYCRNDFRRSLSSGVYVDTQCFYPDDLSSEDLQAALYRRLVQVCSSAEGSMLNPILRAGQDGKFLEVQRAQCAGQTFFESRELCHKYLLEEVLARREGHPILYRLGLFR